jgi:hypothetical protein
MPSYMGIRGGIKVPGLRYAPDDKALIIMVHV